MDPFPGTCTSIANAYRYFNPIAFNNKTFLRSRNLTTSRCLTKGFKRAYKASST